MRYTVLTILVIVLTQSFAQPAWQWSRNLCTTPLGNYYAPGEVRTDNLGNVYVTGYNDKVGPGMASIPDSTYIAKFDGTGALIWSKPVSGRIVALDTDDAQNLLLTGTYSTSTNIYGYGQIIFVTKISPSGSVLWHKTFAGDFCVASAIAGAPNGNIVLCGSLGTNGLYVENTLVTDTHDLFVMKLDGAGTVSWMITGSDLPVGSSLEKHERASAIETDSDENIYLTYRTRKKCGYICGTQKLAMLDKAGQIIKVQNIGKDMDDAYSIATDNSNSVYCVHEINGGTSSGDYVVTKWNAGLAQVAWQIPVGSYMDGINMVSKPAILNDNTFLLAGTIGRWDESAQPYTLTVGSATHTSRSMADICVMRYSCSDGTALECKTASGLRREWGTDITVNSSGNAFVTGFMNQADYNNTTIDTICFDKECLAMPDQFSRQYLAKLNFSQIPVSGLDVRAPEEFIVYPNPGRGTLNVRSVNGNSLQMVIYSAQGEVVRDGIKGSSAQLTGLAEGIYFLKISNPDGVSQTTKVIVQQE